MKLVKFFALAVAALAVSCAAEENKTNAPDFELTESKIYCDVTAGEWENCNVWAWTEGGDNYTQSGNWPGDAIEKGVNPADGKEYYVWTAPAHICGQTIGFIINNGTEQTVDLKLLVEEGAIVALTQKGEDGKWLAAVNGEESEAPAPKEEPVIVFGDHTYGLIGSFNDWSADVAMSVVDGWAVGTIEVTTKTVVDETTGVSSEVLLNEFKVRLDGAWTDSYGFAATEEMPSCPVDGTQFAATYNGGNLKVAEAGTYEVSFTIEGENEYFKVLKK